MTEILFTVDEAIQGGFLTREADHSIFTEVYTLEELRLGVAEVVECRFDEGQAPKLIRLHIMRDGVAENRLGRNLLRFT